MVTSKSGACGRRGRNRKGQGSHRRAHGTIGALVPVTVDVAVRVTVFAVWRVTMTVATPLNRLIELPDR